MAEEDSGLIRTTERRIVAHINPGSCLDGPAAAVPLPPGEEGAGVQVVARRHHRYRYPRLVALRNDPARRPDLQLLQCFSRPALVDSVPPRQIGTVTQFVARDVDGELPVVLVADGTRLRDPRTEE